MGYWENTAYLRCPDVARIASKIVTIFGQEGRREIPRPPERKPDPSDRMQYGRAAENPIWALALIPARNGWTAIKTAPFDLLMESRGVGSKPRLADLAVTLDADCFQFNIYDGAEWMLLECGRNGRFRAAGAAEQGPGIKSDENYSAVEIYGIPMDTTEWFDRFKLIRIDGRMAGALQPSDDSNSLGRQMEVAGDGHSNLIQVNYLIPHRELEIKGARTIYFGIPE